MVVPANGHTADSIEFENAIAATCTTVGSYDSVVYCSVCQAELLREEKEIAMLSHTYNSSVTPPTCTEIGYTTHTCSVCEYAYNSDTVAANGHTEVVDAAVPATCTGAGKTEGKHCSVCEAVLVAQEDTPALGHTEVVDAAVAATTTSTGLTEGSHCSVCSEVIVAQTVIPMLENGGNENQGETNEGGNNNQGGNNEEGNENPATAVAESTASTVIIYAYGNTIVVENATDEILVYNAMGCLVCREAARHVSTGITSITVNTQGVYIVKTGTVVKRVMMN